MRRASLHMLLCQFAMALGLLLSLGSEAWAARPAPQAAVDLEAPAALAEDASLDQLNAQLDLIRQRVTTDASDDLLAELRQSALRSSARPTPCSRCGWPTSSGSTIS